MEPETVAKEPIAIVGVGCVLPDAPDVEAFWANLMAGRSSITDVPAGRWDPALYYDADRTKEDRTYTKIGAFVADDGFDGIVYRLPPKVVEHVDPSQRWALAATRQALLDAGYKTGLKGDEGRDFDRDRCAVILGNAMGGETNKTFAKRMFWPEAQNAIQLDDDFRTLAPERQQAILARAEARYKKGVPAVTEDTMPGHLSNVVAGRIANIFDLGGKNFTTDAACASSFAALDSAVDALQSGEAGLVLWGGSDRSMDITPYVEFSKIGALSPDGSRPFDKDANGFVMGEGCAMFVLKRLADAEADGDRVYAVIRGIGASSDGKGKGITAPNPAGQVKAVVRAYEDAAVDPRTIGYLEAHGTSTPVGDPVELQSVQEAFARLGPVPPRGSIAVGSVKSNIGHLKAAAGAAGMLKAVLALHHRMLPPSINVRTLNPRIDWASSPFKVQTQGEPWQGEAPRRAAVSSFGFGGTNFHVVLEQHVPGRLKVQATGASTARPPADVPAKRSFDHADFARAMDQRAPLEAEPLVVAAADAPRALALATPDTFTKTGQGPRIRQRFHPVTEAGLTAGERLGIAVADPGEIPKRLELAQKAAANPAAQRLAFNQGVFLGRGAPQGKVAFLFPGQGTQYVNMLRDLAMKYEVVRNTFHEADEVLYDDLGGIKLTDILWPEPDTPQARHAAEEKLKLTEFTQPAVLAADVAILRLLSQWGVHPDIVAGHSLGEYGALVAAGVLSFSDALHAVAARGREMAHVDVPDLGKMAAVPADWETVQKALQGIDEYVIPANKNCPSQTVLAGSSRGVDQAVVRLKERGLDAQFLPVSAAFHSNIVAPASGPLRRVLARLDVHPPKVRVLSNVGAAPYGDDPEAIRDNLAVQVANPVEWIDIIERMYDEGVRVFVEVGPKLALTGFARDILRDRPDAVAIGANHPKKGGVAHINELFAFLGAWGFQPKLPSLDDPTVYTLEHRDPAAPFSQSAVPVSASWNELESLAHRMETITANLRQAAHPQSLAPAPAAPPGDAKQALARMEAFGFCTDDIGISGVAVGLPGAHKPLFAEDNFERILRGENLIDALPETERRKLADKNIVKLQKGSDGSAHFQVVSDIAQVIQLAGRRGSFDLAEWGVPGDLAASLDRTFQYAIAAGLEALREAGIPLQRTYLKTSTGGHLPKDWKLPSALRDETGVIFASAFPGYDNLLRDVSRYLADKYAGRTLDELQALYQELVGSVEDRRLRGRLQDWFDAEFSRLQDVLPDHGASRYEFNRKFLFEVLSMGHAQFAQFIGARGPNTQVNAACASTTQAIAVAEDWIRTGRCRRVVVVGADDVTSDAMFEWIGSGFLASGAATTKSLVAEAALPFDARRHGMIVGMGAVGMVIEAVPECTRRGMRPIARLLATEVANSAFHGSRLDVPHISECMQSLVAKASRRYGIDAASIAAQTVFVSHETYTPARGGSASAEIHALRATFGAAANKVVVANTKGFTGHPQGAGIEDAIALKMLQRGQVPPIANFRDPDPELGDLNLSKGGAYDVRWALRLAAGFGSQVAMSLCELVAREDERIADPARHDAWLQEVSGLTDPRTEVVHRTLRFVDEGPPQRAPRTTSVEEPPPPAAPAPPQVPVPAIGPVDEEAVLSRLTDMVAQQTGYPREMLEPDLDMEADLGIDTVKQAELFGAIRDHYGLGLEEGVQIKDYPTLRKVAGYFAARVGVDAAETATDVASVAPVAATAPAAQSASTSSEAEVLAKLTDMVAQQTGYPREMLEPDLDMEADLGIDTVKQAELFGAIRDHYGLGLEEGVQIKDYPTLRKVAGYFAGRVAAPAAPTVTSAAMETAEAPAQQAANGAPGPSVVRRRVPICRDAPIPDQDNRITQGPVLVLGDADTAFLDAWKRAGFAPSFRLAGDQPVVGILCLATRAGTAAEERVGLLFERAKALAHRLGKGTFVAAVTAQDGAHGLKEVRDEAMGAVAGLAKALRKELPHCIVKAIDVHPDDRDAGERVVPEVLRGGTRTEVAYGRDGTRRVVDVILQPLPAGVPDVAGKGLVVSGGAQGITVEMLMAIAPQAPRLLLLGRTRLPPEAEAWAGLDETGWKAKEQEAMAQLKAAGERVTPVAVQKAVSPMRKAAEVHRNLQRLQAAGAEVLYAPVDVTDAPRVAEAVAWARGQWGSIDGVLHAAGIEVSKDLASKDRSQFDQVFGIKVQGWQALMEATREDRLWLVAAFTSVAGRFGNIGQTDYSAANEYLAKAVRREAARRGVPHAFTIGWGPWGEVGMATRGSIMQVMDAAGVTPIGTAEGVQAFLSELAHEGTTECIVSGDLGAIDLDGQVQDGTQGGAQDAPDGSDATDTMLAEVQQVVSDNPAHFRLVDKVLSVAPGALTARVLVDQGRDPGLRDHRVDGVPYLPGVFGIEAFAEAAGLLVPGELACTGARDVRFVLPLKQLRGEAAEGIVSARVVSGPDAPVTEVACTLTSQFRRPDGTPLGEPKLHFEGTVLFGSPPEGMAAEVPLLAPLRSRPDIYPPFFHGPSFQVLDRAGPLGDPSVALFRRPEEPHFGAGPGVHLTHPMVVEALFQTCGLSVLEREGRMCLPAGIRSLEILTPAGLPDGLRLVAAPRGTDADGNRLFDAYAVGKDQTMAVRLTGFAMVDTGPAEGRAPAGHGADQAGTHAAPANSQGGGKATDARRPILTSMDLPRAPVELPDVDGIVFHAVPVTSDAPEAAWFTDEERQQHAAFKAPKRQDEWRAGRLAAKAAASTALGIAARDVSVRSDEEGPPRLVVQGRASDAFVSITHRDGLAIAAVSTAPLGIDLETVEERAHSFLEEAFSAPEIEGLRAAAQPAFDATCMWAAKEAAFKRVGTGLKADLRAHEVSSDGRGGATVAGPLGHFGVRFYDVDGRVLALSSAALDAMLEARP